MPEPITTLPVCDKRLWYGDKTLYARPLAAVLNSRQNRYPTGGEAWVRSTLQAVAYVCRDEKVLLASFGMNTWELASWAAGEVLGPLVALVGVTEKMEDEPVRRRLIDMARSFKLMPQQTLLIPYREPARGSPKQVWHARDRWVLDHAARLYPVSIRPGGLFDTALREKEYAAHKVIEDFRVEYSPGKPEPVRTPDPDAVRDTIPEADWSYVVHWTRRTPQPWPSENHDTFYRDLVNSRDQFARNAEATLRRILEEGRIRATSRRMPGDRPLVSLSAAHPAEMAPLMTWRPRQVRPAYEPWGVGIRRNVLEAIGGRVVRYVDATEAKHLPKHERAWVQTVQPDGFDWSVEQEWRVEGDIELENLPREAVVVLAPTREIAIGLEKSTGIPVFRLREE